LKIAFMKNSRIREQDETDPTPTEIGFLKERCHSGGPCPFLSCVPMVANKVGRERISTLCSSRWPASGPAREAEP
jgi:hypothetical protein